METPRIWPLLTVLALMIAASLVASRIGEPWLAPETGIRRPLPRQVGAATGHELWFCSNAACAEAYGSDEFGADTEQVCPLCKSGLDHMAPVERRVLPPGTEILRNVYRDPDGASFFVSVVVSGRDRLSLHRPENCLPGQGVAIRDSRMLKTGLDKGRTLRTRLLDVRRQIGGTDAAIFSYFTYWYVAPGRATPSQWQLFAWIAADRLFHGKMDRWAYVAVAHDYDPLQDGDAQADLKRFLAELYPLIIAEATDEG